METLERGMKSGAVACGRRARLVDGVANVAIKPASPAIDEHIERRCAKGTIRRRDRSLRLGSECVCGGGVLEERRSDARGVLRGRFQKACEGSGIVVRARIPCRRLPAEERFAFELCYDARAYAQLMATQSDHRRLPPSRRRRLLAAIEEVINSSGGSFRVDWESRLYLAQRLESPRVFP